MTAYEQAWQEFVFRCGFTSATDPGTYTNFSNTRDAFAAGYAAGTASLIPPLKELVAALEPLKVLKIDYKPTR